MLIKVGLLIDGTGFPPQHDRYLDIEKGKIAAVGCEADFAADQVGQAVDYSSYTVLPGLIDAHVHLFLEGITEAKIREQRWREPKEVTLLRAAKNLELTLRKGVTTVRDLAGPDGMSVTLQQAVSKKILFGPRVLTCNRAISVTGGHFYYAGGREADGPAEIAKAVREQIKAGAECIKIMMTGSVNFRTENAGAVEFSAEEIQAAVTEAERFNRPVSVHANGVQGVRRALAAGVQSVEHGALLDDETTDILCGSSAYWVPTITPFVQMLNYSRGRSTVNLPETGLERVYARHCAMVKRGIEAGAKIVAGTDAGALGVEHGDVWQEIALLAALGMPPIRAIAAGTGLAAQMLGVGEGTGIVAVGKKADLLVIDGNPLADMQSLRNIVQVYKDGDKVL